MNDSDGFDQPSTDILKQGVWAGRIPLSRFSMSLGIRPLDSYGYRSCPINLVAGVGMRYVARWLRFRGCPGVIRRDKVRRGNARLFCGAIVTWIIWPLAVQSQETDGFSEDRQWVYVYCSGMHAAMALQIEVESVRSTYETEAIKYGSLARQADATDEQLEAVKDQVIDEYSSGLLTFKEMFDFSIQCPLMAANVERSEPETEFATIETHSLCAAVNSLISTQMDPPFDAVFVTQARRHSDSARRMGATDDSLGEYIRALADSYNDGSITWIEIVDVSEECDGF
ncbi:MAG: hypothetical protein OXQ89_18700 [Rhodospirillaceae bacterium]|nr:hypothetical protein [Rhodospirillaceae bacterium]MDD9999774.1 hypothetical protein [Rhodospirillaceae bacterium]